MLTDPLFLALAVPAVLIAGISKGGFGGGVGIMAVPLMSLAIAPPQAAAIMLPILCVMDVVLVWNFRGKWDSVNMRILIAAAILGIALGTASFRYMDVATTRLMIGLIAVGFTLNYWFRDRGVQAVARGPSVWRGGFWGTVAGFTSFTAHAGGPPVGVYLLPQHLDKTVYQATTVILFIVVNYIKLIPYTWLGQFTTENLLTSAAFAPLAVVGVLLGVWLHHRISRDAFYRVCYVFLFLTGLKLLFDGVTAFV